MACERFSDALKAHALGEALPDAAAAHLAVCARCQVALERERHLHDLIAGAIGQVVGVAPMPGFDTRIHESAGDRPRVSARLRRVAAVPLGLAAVLTVSIGLPMLARHSPSRDLEQAPPKETVVREASGASSPSPAPAIPPPVGAPRPREIGARLSSLPTAGRARHADIDVVVPPGQAAAIARLAARLSDSSTARQMPSAAEAEPAVVVAVAGDLAVAVPAAIAIAELTVPALVVSNPFSGE